MLWNLIQQSQISDARAEAEAARRHAHDTVSDVRQIQIGLTSMQADVDRLSLACTAMWELLKESEQFTDEQIRAKIEEVDLRDGVLDGKLREVSTAPSGCPDCGRRNGHKRQTCLYCGARL